MFGRELLKLRHCLIQFQTFAINQTIGILDIANLIGREFTSFQAFAVDALRHAWGTGYHRVSRHVTIDAAVHANKCMRADMAKLVDACLATEYHPITNMHMTRKRCAIRHDGFAANDAVVRNVHIGHDPVVITDNRDAFVLGRAATNRDKFMDGISIANFETCRFTGVLLVLRIIANLRKLVDAILFADRRRPVDNNVTINARTVTDRDVVADNTKWPDLDVVADRRGL